MQVSNGALDMAKVNMESLLRYCAQPLTVPTDSLTAAQNKSLFETVHELVRHVTSPNTLVREQVRK
jgi:transformation/transcription domain-associated protein